MHRHSQVQSVQVEDIICAPYGRKSMGNIFRGHVTNDDKRVALELRHIADYAVELAKC
jgi:hypothetical protein